MKKKLIVLWTLVLCFALPAGQIYLSTLIYNANNDGAESMRELGARYYKHEH